MTLLFTSCTLLWKTLKLATLPFFNLKCIIIERERAPLWFVWSSVTVVGSCPSIVSTVPPPPPREPSRSKDKPQRQQRGRRKGPRTRSSSPTNLTLGQSTAADATVRRTPQVATPRRKISDPFNPSPDGAKITADGGEYTAKIDKECGFLGWHAPVGGF